MNPASSSFVSANGPSYALTPLRALMYRRPRRLGRIVCVARCTPVLRRLVDQSRQCRAASWSTGAGLSCRRRFAQHHVAVTRKIRRFRTHADVPGLGHRTDIDLGDFVRSERVCCPRRPRDRVVQRFCADDGKSCREFLAAGERAAGDRASAPGERQPRALGCRAQSFTALEHARLGQFAEERANTTDQLLARGFHPPPIADSLRA